MIMYLLNKFKYSRVYRKYIRLSLINKVWRYKDIFFKWLWVLYIEIYGNKYEDKE